MFTDFGVRGPYVGQMHAVLARQAPGVPVIDLMHDAPANDPRAAAYLLAALAAEFAPGDVCIAVVDPGVGGARPPVILEADGRVYVGPGNGLFDLVQRRADTARQWRITWQPARLSDSFHGRDLFAPAAAMLARGETPERESFAEDWRTAAGRPGGDWPDDLAEIIYTDRFGNLMTGLRAGTLERSAALEVGRRALLYARVFADAPGADPFWYENASGLVEIAVADGSAAECLGAGPGDAVSLR